MTEFETKLLSQLLEISLHLEHIKSHLRDISYDLRDDHESSISSALENLKDGISESLLIIKDNL